MSPLALLYILFASSPLLNNWHHESTFPSTWNAMPFGEHHTPSYWGEESTYEPEHMNWLLRKAVRSTEYPTSIRSIMSEMTGRRFFSEEPRFFSEESRLFSEEPRHFENIESVRPIVKLIKRIAEVNPIMIEKILSCPVTRRFVEKVLRNVEPSTIRMVEKMIKKNVPVAIREKVVRKVVKALLNKESSIFGRRSIMSEMYPTESIFSTPFFNAENLIEKIFSTRRSEVPEVVLAKIIRKLIAKSIFAKYPTESIFAGKHFEHEPEHFEVLSKILSKVLSKSAKTHELKNLIKKVLRNSEVTPFNMYPTESSIFGKYEPETSFFNTEYETPIFSRWNKLSKHF